jgi:molybdopterin synthase catalytic subunit
MFVFTRDPIDAARYRPVLDHASAGGYASFEGWVRNHNDDRSVLRLEYEAYEELGRREGEKIIAEARQRFPIVACACVHRLGTLDIGAMAVWVGVSAAHRDGAFAACRYIIDEVKARVPIWKKEHYAEGDSGWINCQSRTAPAAPALR